MKYISYLLAISGIYLFVYACQPAPCTDDGCPEWNELVNPPENPDVGMIEHDYEIVPVVATNNKDNFVYSLNECITHLYKNVPIAKRIPRELIIAQAALETGWGTSRFANEANNLFGIRTWNKDEPYLLPIPWTEWPGWGVKVFETKCDSVKYYVDLLNNHSAYEKFITLREKTKDSMQLIKTLDKFSTTTDYDERVIRMINKIRKMEEK
jgi:Bax protein